MLKASVEIRYTYRMSVKEQVLQAIQRLPNDINSRDVTDEIASLAAIQDAERDIEDGRLISNDEMNRGSPNGAQDSLDRASLR